MTILDDLPAERPPAGEGAGKTTAPPPPRLKEVGPESEVRGGHEADIQEETP